MQGNPHKTAWDSSAETLQARREWDGIFKVVKDKNCQPRIIQVAKLSFKNEGEMRTFPDKQKLKEFISTRPASQEMLKAFLQVGMNGC